MPLCTSCGTWLPKNEKCRLCEESSCSTTTSSSSSSPVSHFSYPIYDDNSGSTTTLSSSSSSCVSHFSTPTSELSERDDRAHDDSSSDDDSSDDVCASPSCRMNCLQEEEACLECADCSRWCHARCATTSAVQRQRFLRYLNTFTCNTCRHIPWVNRGDRASSAIQQRAPPHDGGRTSHHLMSLTKLPDATPAPAPAAPSKAQAVPAVKSVTIDLAEEEEETGAHIV